MKRLLLYVLVGWVIAAALAGCESPAAKQARAIRQHQAAGGVHRTPYAAPSIYAASNWLY